MAARHVVEPYEPELRNGQKEIICTGIASERTVIWRCRGVTLLGTADIALLMVEGASALPEILHQITLTTRMPRIGEEVVMVGMKHHADAPVDISSETKLSMMAASGKVTARYEKMRDRSLLPYPCFEVDCAARGGMSGGPVFDKDGFLIGLITSSLEGETEGPTFVSLPWPSFVETINPIWPKGFYKGPTSLIEIDRRICGLHRPDALQITKDTASGNRIVTYHHWDHP